MHAFVITFFSKNVLRYGLFGLVHLSVCFSLQPDNGQWALTPAQQAFLIIKVWLSAADELSKIRVREFTHQMGDQIYTSCSLRWFTTTSACLPLSHMQSFQRRCLQYYLPITRNIPRCKFHKPMTEVSLPHRSKFHHKTLASHKVSAHILLPLDTCAYSPSSKHLCKSSGSLEVRHRKAEDWIISCSVFFFFFNLWYTSLLLSSTYGNGLVCLAYWLKKKSQVERSNVNFFFVSAPFLNIVGNTMMMTLKQRVVIHAATIALNIATNFSCSFTL